MNTLRLSVQNLAPFKNMTCCYTSRGLQERRGLWWNIINISVRTRKWNIFRRVMSYISTPELNLCLCVSLKWERPFRLLEQVQAMAISASFLAPQTSQRCSQSAGGYLAITDMVNLFGSVKWTAKLQVEEASKSANRKCVRWSFAAGVLALCRKKKKVLGGNMKNLDVCTYFNLRHWEIWREKLTLKSQQGEVMQGDCHDDGWNAMNLKAPETLFSASGKDLDDH